MRPALRLVAIFCMALICAGHAYAQRVDPAAITRHAQKTLARNHVPGAAIAVIAGGEVILLRGFGKDQKGQPIGPETGFRLGSMSKAFTAMAALRLVEAGVITLDQPVADFLPPIRAPGWQGLTLRHLLTHSSGLPRTVPAPPAGAPLAAHIAAMRDISVIPGAPHLYSSANYLLAAAVLEHASGQPFPELLKTQVLDPLDMRPLPPVQGSRYWAVWPRTVPLREDPGRLATACVTATASEMVRFLEFQLGDGTWQGQTLLDPRSVEDMHRGQVSGDGFRYGLGWREMPLAGVRSVQHGGVLPDYSGKMILLPDQRAAVVVLTNVSTLAPFGLRPTSHALAGDIARYLAGGPLDLPRIGLWRWLVLYWAGLGLILLHQIFTLIRVALGRDPARAPRKAALTDLGVSAALLGGLPWVTGLGWAQMADQTPDLALWVAAVAGLGLATAAFRTCRHPG